MSNDFIPSPDDQFDAFFTALNTYVTANYDALGLTGTQQAAFNTAHTNWEGTWTNWQTEQNTYDSLLTAKNAARAAAEALIRPLNSSVQANPNISALTKEAAGLPVHKTTRTATPDIETHPVLYKVDNEHLLQRLWFSDQDTVGKKGKPAAAAYCEIRQQIVPAGAPAPTDPNAMPYLATDSKAPHRTDLEPKDVDKTAYYCQRWVNKTQQPGPWGPVTGYPVV